MRARPLSALAAALVIVALALAVAGCGGSGSPSSSGSGSGTGVATIWVTKDRGSTLVQQGTVASGQTLLRGLRSIAGVKTRYGGRFVQSIYDVSGDASAHRDWFWFVNGLLGNRSAADYRLHAGDIAWWDYRDWSKDVKTEVVVGAFPEPFLHGYDGHVRPAAVRYAPSLQAGAPTIARLIHAISVAPLGKPVASDANVFELVTGKHRFIAAMRKPGSGPTGAVVFTYSGRVGDLLPGGPRPYLRSFSVP